MGGLLVAVMLFFPSGIIVALARREWPRLRRAGALAAKEEGSA
jgi:hypothetical protein